MILRNRKTIDVVEIEYAEFRKKFSKEIEIALESYQKMEVNKVFYKYKNNDSIASDFYFQLQWNFKNFGNSVWYIEKM